MPILHVGFLNHSMPKGLKRYYGRGHLHFLTFSCHRRLPLLGTVQARDRFVVALSEIRDRHGFLLIGYVVMPEHVHLLISEVPAVTPSIIVKVLKERVSRNLGKIANNGGKRPPRFWQSRFYDFNVYTQFKIKEKLDYMHANPVVRKLVSDSKDWPWSSFLFYSRGEAGLVRIDLLD